MLRLDTFDSRASSQMLKFVLLNKNKKTIDAYILFAINKLILTIFYFIVTTTYNNSLI